MTSIALNPFDPAAIDDETRAFNQRVEELLAQGPATHEVPPEVTRQAREDGKGMFGPVQLVDEASYRTIPGPGLSELPIRVMVPPGTINGVYMHIHGGGWVLGRAHHSDVRNSALANSLGLAVVSVDYRLAPEHPYPAGPDDCEAAFSWLANNAKAEFGSDKLVIGGESAGANLAAVTLLRARDRHGYTGFKAANMVFGVYDLTATPSVSSWGPRNLILSTPMMEWFFDCYTGRQDRRNPDISPLYGRLHDMPPALFTVGTMDPLLDDSLFMKAIWEAAGNEAEIAIYPGVIHGFTGFPIALGRKANERIDAFLRECLQRS